MSHSLRRRIVPQIIARVFGTISLVVLVAGMQVGLPWMSYRIADQTKPNASSDGAFQWNLFWNQRFRFQRLFQPVPHATEVLQCLSGTVCGDEFIALFATTQPKAKVPPDAEYQLRCNLRTGAMAFSAAPPCARYVVSDGRIVWFLTAHSSPICPFIWEGRPVALVESPRDQLLCQLIEFKNGEWEDSEQFALMPKTTSVSNSPHFKVFSANGRIMPYYEWPGQFAYKNALELGTEDQAKAYQNTHRKYLNSIREPELQEMGWISQPESALHLNAPRKPASAGLRQAIYQSDYSYPLRPIARFWSEKDEFCSIHPSTAIHMKPGGMVRAPGFQCQPLHDTKGTSSQFIASPVPWESVESAKPSAALILPTLLGFGTRGKPLATDRGDYLVVTSSDDRVYILNFGRNDDRTIVMELKDGQMRLIGQTGSGIGWLSVLDAAIALGLIIVVPSMILVLIALVIQRRYGVAFYEGRLERMELASIGRRALARSIDLMLVGSLFASSIISHPGTVSWLNLVNETRSHLASKLPARGLTWNFVQAYLASLQEFFTVCTSLPVNDWLLASAVMALLLQVVLQGRTGFTIGKWLLGIQLLRTTQRPCGISRSLLRELGLLADSVFLVSWIPGVISILSTCTSQRLGDLLADTIVVRLPRGRC